jgi:hypothetical protein
MPNYEKCWAVVREIEAHPHEWNQRSWGARNDCGTTACFAGRAVLMEGLTFRWEALPHGQLACLTEDGKSILQTAMDILELTVAGAEQLFAGANSLEDIKLTLKQWETAEVLE